MRKQKQAPRHVTPEQREQIRSMTPHVQQKVIAAQLGLSTHLVRKVQAQFGMRPHPAVVISPETEKQILALLPTHGQPSIARRLDVKPYLVYKVMQRHGAKKAPGVVGHRYHFDKPTLSWIRARICENEAAVAREFGTTHSWVRRFRRKMWDCVGDKHWRRKPSPFAAKKNFDVKLARPEDFLKIVSRVTALCFDGRLPDVDDGTFVAAMMTGFTMTALRNESQEARAAFSAGLLGAVRTLRMSENGWTN